MKLTFEEEYKVIIAKQLTTASRADRVPPRTGDPRISKNPCTERDPPKPSTNPGTLRDPRVSRDPRINGTITSTVSKPEIECIVIDD